MSQIVAIGLVFLVSAVLAETPIEGIGVSTRPEIEAQSRHGHRKKTTTTEKSTESSQGTYNTISPPLLPGFLPNGYPVPGTQQTIGTPSGTVYVPVGQPGVQTGYYPQSSNVPGYVQPGQGTPGSTIQTSGSFPVPPNNLPGFINYQPNHGTPGNGAQIQGSYMVPPYNLPGLYPPPSQHNPGNTITNQGSSSFQPTYTVPEYNGYIPPYYGVPSDQLPAFNKTASLCCTPYFNGATNSLDTLLCCPRAPNGSCPNCSNLHHYIVNSWEGCEPTKNGQGQPPTGQ